LPGVSRRPSASTSTPSAARKSAAARCAAAISTPEPDHRCDRWTTGSSYRSGSGGYGGGRGGAFAVARPRGAGGGGGGGGADAARKSAAARCAAAISTPEPDHRCDRWTTGSSYRSGSGGYGGARVSSCVMTLLGCAGRGSGAGTNDDAALARRGIKDRVQTR